jgi:NAD-dependent deacetylase
MHPPIDDPLDDLLAQAARWLHDAERVAVLTGAGISKESGVPTFRDTDGLWEGHRVEDVATPEAFKRDPVLVWRFYNARRQNLRRIVPNPGHRALVELEARYPGDRFTLVTQNVDNLHRLAGSRRVFEIHGNLNRTRCTRCGDIETRDLAEDLGDQPLCARCHGLLRPDIVWFHEMLPEDVWSAAAEAVESCRLLLVVGTSAAVYPAAGLIPAARAAGAKVVEVNPKPTDATGRCDLVLRGPSGLVLPRLVEHLRV